MNKSKGFSFRTKVEAVIAFLVIGSLIIAGVAFSTPIKLGTDPTTGDEWTLGWDMIRNSNGNTYQVTTANVFTAIYNLNTTGGTVWLPSELFLITAHNGIKIYHDNITLIGYGCTLRKAESSGNVGQVFEIIGADNITIKGITFDQDKNNSNHDDTGTAGAQWIGRIGTGSKNIHFEDCSFINGEQNGIVTGSNASNIFITNCFFDGFGEHPFYLDRVSNFFVDNCIVLNWAKKLRGYGPKVMRSDNVYFTDCYFEQNEDGTGHPTTGGYGDYGVYGSVLSNTNHTYFTRCEWRGDGTTNIDKSVINLDATTLNTSYRNCIFDDMGPISIHASLPATTICEAISCNFCFTHSTTYTKLLSTMKDCLIVDPYYMEVDRDFIKLVDCKIVNSSNTYHGWLMNIKSDDVRIDGCEFYNWDYRGPYFSTGVNGSVINCYFNRGTTSVALKVNSGTRVIGNHFDDAAGTGYTVGAEGSNSIFTNNVIESTLNNNDFRGALDKFSQVSNNVGLDCLIIPTANITGVSDVPGRMWYDTSGHKLYVCEGAGVWKSTTFT